MQKTLLTFLLFLLCLVSPGCAVGRTWFQMDSNSPMPFFGFDLTPRLPKRTSQVDDDHQEELVSFEETPHEAEVNRLTPVVNRPTTKEKAEKGLLRLSRISTLLGEDKDVDVTFSGPKSAFTR